MGSFNATLRAIGDVTSLKATVELADDRLSIVAGSTEIGTWGLDEIRLEEIPTGYRMAAEGEQILIELRDVESFAAELATRTKKKSKFAKPTRSRSESSESKKRSKTAAVATPTVARLEKSTAEDTSTPTPAKAPRDPRTSGAAGKGLGIVDGILAKAQKKFGPYLPNWMFSRAMSFIVIAGIVTMLLFPGPFSVLLLIAGALLVLFGAVVYSDTVLASKWLPGRATPQQALLLGLSVLLLGVLLGIVAK
jgi:hypothetical protein